MHNAIAASKNVTCIDVGTNSIKLLIADLANGNALPVLELSATTRLGEGMTADNRRLLEIPMRRTMEGLEAFVTAARDYAVHGIACVGTAALRDADNAADFVSRAREKLGLNLEVISGDEEARLSFLAVRQDPHWRSQLMVAVIDVGGGSTEVIEGVPGSHSIERRRSVNLGAVKLTERYLRSDPPTLDQLSAASSAISSEFDRIGHLPGFVPIPERCVVGVGGTLTNLAAIRIGGIKDPLKIHGFRLSAEDIELLIKQLSALSVTERQQLPGLDPRRADIILGGAMLALHALATLGAGHLDVSTRGLRWGVLYDRFLHRD